MNSLFSIAFLWVWIGSSLWLGGIGMQNKCGFFRPFLASLLLLPGVGTLLAIVILLKSEKLY